MRSFWMLIYRLLSLPFKKKKLPEVSLTSLERSLLSGIEKTEAIAIKKREENEAHQLKLKLEREDRIKNAIQPIHFENMMNAIGRYLGEKPDSNITLSKFDADIDIMGFEVWEEFVNQFFRLCKSNKIKIKIASHSSSFVIIDNKSITAYRKRCEEKLLTNHKTIITSAYR